MKKLVYIIVILSILVSCSSKSSSMSSPLDFIASVSSTDLHLETGGLEALGISESDIMKKRGEPRSRGSSASGDIILSYEDYRYTVMKDRLVAYTLEKGQQTANQVKIGDDRDQIVKAYGQHYYTRTDNRLSLIGYIDKENNRVIEFAMNLDKVESIFVSELSLFSK